MSAQSIVTILTRAMSDEAFADLLFTDAEQALAQFDKYAAAPPEERMSMWGIAAQSGV
jgi:hypothetical protein